MAKAVKSVATLELGPILRSLFRNRLSTALLIIQIALTMCVVINCEVGVRDFLSVLEEPVGVDPENLFTFWSESFDQTIDKANLIEEDLELIRSLPGVRSAVVSNAIPLGPSGWSIGVRAEDSPDAVTYSPSVYRLDEHGLETLGVELSAGEWFSDQEVPPPPKEGDKVLLSEDLAKKLFPDLSPAEVVGKSIYGGGPLKIVGIIDTLIAPWPSQETMVQAVKHHSDTPQYLVRTAPGRLEETMLVVEHQLMKSNRGRVLRDILTFDQVRTRASAPYITLASIFGVIMIVLIFVIALGMVGLVSFNVRERTKIIGMRRALGANRRDILRYFLMESAVIATIGIGLGLALAMSLNLLLLTQLEFPSIGAGSLGVTGVGMFAVLLLAVLGPSMRASAVPPAVATRTV